MPHKLRLKRTPAEDAARQLKKARRAARKADAGHGRHTHTPTYNVETGPSTSSYVFDFDSDGLASERAQLVDEEALFREKMDEAAQEDAGIYGVESKLNDYAADTVPRRWRQDTGTSEVDPSGMDDETYAEWVRAGMWKCESQSDCDNLRY